MPRRNERIEKAIQTILERFENGTIGEVIAQSMTRGIPTTSGHRINGRSRTAS